MSKPRDPPADRPGRFVDGELRLWEDGAGLSGYIREETDGEAVCWWRVGTGTEPGCHTRDERPYTERTEMREADAGAYPKMSSHQRNRQADPD